MNTKEQNNLSGILSGSAFFILWGLALISGELPHEWGAPVWIQNGFFISLLFLPPIGMCIGWIRGFPRWSYPYVVHMFFISLYMTNVATPGFLFGRELWGWRAWIPLMVVVVIALAVTRSFHPIIKFFTSIRSDWTLLTFGMFGFMPLIIFIMFDEVDRLYSLYFMIALTFIMLGTVFVYLRSIDHAKRVRALVTGVLVSLVIASIAPNVYWLGVMNVKVVPALIAGFIIFLFMFSPSLLALGRRKSA